MQLTKSVFVETKIWGCNVGYVLTDEGIVIIDTPQRPTVALRLRKELELLGDIRYIIHTEGHRDHFTGDCFFAVPVIAHEKTRDSIVNTSKEQMLSRVAIIDPDGYDLLKESKLNPPQITFSDGLELHLGSHLLTLIHHPGHTLGQTSVLVREDGVLFTGDNVFYKTQSFINSGDVYQWLASLDEISKLDFDYIVPGHGEVCNRSYLSEQKAFIQEWLDTVASAIDMGWSKEEAMERISFEKRYPMSIGTEDLMQNVQRNNVAYLYGVLTSNMGGAAE